MDNLAVVVPFWNGHATIGRLLDSLPADLPVVVVDDVSDQPLSLERDGVRVTRLEQKGYFTGAVNAGFEATGRRDVLILNQDTWLEGTAWLDLLADNRNEYGLIGEGIAGVHPAWPNGYIHGTFMYVRRDVIDALGPMDAVNYPLWGSTCEYQLRACRRGFRALPIPQGQVPGFHHEREGGKGSAIRELLKRQHNRRGWLIRTPPLVSVIIPAYNYGRYLTDAINSLVGGETSLGYMPGQTLQSFEVIIVDDGSTDETADVCVGLTDDWKGIHYLWQRNRGTPAANNAGIRMARGKYITVLCADDMMQPDRLEQLVRVAEANPHAVVYDNLLRFADGELGKPFPLDQYDFETLLYKNHMHCGILYPRKAWEEVGGYPEVMRHGREDWAFNVALGIHGWCGVHSGTMGYLYRRENQNRTLTNTTPGWHRYFLNQLRLLFPGIYEGDRPMACCGGRGRARSNGGGARAAANRSAPSIPMAANALAGAESGLVLIQYRGGNDGTETWFGPVTNQRYQFGRNHPVGYVDRRDAPGLLATRERGRQVFRPYRPPKPAVTQPVRLKEPPELAEDELEPPEIGYPDPGLMTVSDIRDTALTANPGVLEAMLEAERGGKARKTAIQALEAALE